MFIEPSPEGIITPDSLEPYPVVLMGDYLCAAFDPGGKTGWSLFAVAKKALLDPDEKILANITFWSAGEFSGSESSHAYRMSYLVRSWRVASTIMEDFILRKFTMGRELLAPVRVTAAFMYALEHEVDPDDPYPERYKTVVFQPPSLAMSGLVDGVQREVGLWLPGQPHANDATKHAVTWLRRKKAILSKQKG